MKTLKFRRPMACLFVLFTAIGCGGSNGLKLVPVKGKVMVAGSSPLKKGIVVFVPNVQGVPVASTDAKSQKKVLPILGGSAITDDQGNFVLKHTTLKSGIEPGEYSVFFSLMQMPDGSPLPDQSKVGEPKTAQELGAVELVPVEYATMRSTKYPTTVAATGGSFEFDIPELKAPKGK